MADRILIAGGDPAFRIGLRARLAAACYDVAQAQSTAEALERVQTATPKVVIAIQEPDDPGAAQLCAVLRADPATARARIIALVDKTGRLAALRAGADDAQSHPIDALMLLARVRRLIGQPRLMTHVTGMAEAPAALGPPPRIALIAPDGATAIGWRHAVAPKIDADFDITTPARALQDVTYRRAADLYLIAADIEQAGDGLRLLSELRARLASRDSGFVILLDPTRASMAPIALDLGAGDVLPMSLREPPIAEEAALRIKTQLTQRNIAIELRREDERNRLWAITDPLTGLFNRRHALPRLEQMAADAWHTRQRLAVMVLDLDRFKAVNDRAGHAAGDAVLAQIANRLTNAVRPDDLLARIGGEEFLFCRQAAAPEEAVALAEALRQAVAATPVALPGISGGGKLFVTASIGIALIGPQDLAATGGPPSGQALMARADRALLAAKTTGRNRVLVAPLEAAA